MYSVTLERFEGPLDLLLKLIEKEELLVTDISLAKVTEQYLAYIDNTPTLRADDLADFLVIAARLLLIKSRVLLPHLFMADEEAVTDTLTEELARYRLYVSAGTLLYRQYRANQVCFVRERMARVTVASFSPASNAGLEYLEQAYVGILAEIGRLVRPKPELITRTISLQERITVLRTLFSNANSVDFRQALANTKTRTEVIVTFLALLELVKQRHVVVAQEEGTDIIRITRYDNSTT